MSGLHFHELIRKIEEHEGRKYLMVDDFMLNKVLCKITEVIGIVKFDDTKVFTDTDNKVSDNITL